jgi:hypothetical protein
VGFERKLRTAGPTESLRYIGAVVPRKSWIERLGRRSRVLFVLLSSCAAFEPTPFEHTTFPLECRHATLSCDSCHTTDLTTPIAAACEACHAADAPESHGPERTECGECHEACDWSESVSPHPGGFETPDVHGLAANLQESTCTDCHGSDLAGGEVGVSGCDDCHAEAGHADWRTDCTFCHGGADGDVQGLPPEDIDNETDEDEISFKSHPEHARVEGHPAYDCATCHEMPTDVLSVGHAFDDTAGAAEVDFSGLAAGGTYEAATCGVYCHGNGQIAGTVADGATPLGCDDCHRTTTQLSQLSGAHALHMSEDDVTCADCHTDVNAAGAVTVPEEHVDGTVTLAAAAIGWNAGADTCTVACHDEDHDDAWWYGGGHPAGYEAGDQHGTDSLLTFVEGDCRDCHGADLEGGSAGVACEDCHDDGWTRDCTYCHGGVLDATGAPPEDLDSTTAEGALTFQSHHAHMDDDDHATYDCDQCHGDVSLSYVDALTDAGHWFDATPGESEVDFSDGLSPAAIWTGSGCNNAYCHGTGEGGSTGDIADGTSALDCNDCHPSATSGEAAFEAMSGEHEEHMDEGAECFECHNDVVDSSFSIRDESLHVDGEPDVALAPSTDVTVSGGQCQGACHGDEDSEEEHDDDGDVDW